MAALIKDTSSLEWGIVKKFVQKRLAELRLENDADLDVIETSVIRGKIRMCQEIFDLDQAPPKVEVPNTNYFK